MSDTRVLASAAAELQRLAGWRKPAIAPGELQDCTLVVPTCQRPKVMMALLQRLLRLPDTPGEVVVVDGSRDKAVGDAVAEWARVSRLPFDLVYVKSPTGLTLQRNAGLDASSREFIFYLDDDCWPEPGYFRFMRQVFLDDPAGRIGAVRGFLTNGIDLPLTPLWHLRHALGLVPRGEPGKYYPTGTSSSWNSVAPFSGVRDVDVLAGGAAAYRREVFAKHRFSRFFHGYSFGEDIEMSRRLARDWKLVVCGDARVDHRQALGGRPSGWAGGRMAMRNRYFIWKRYSPDAKALDGLKFWLDHLLIVFYHLAGFLRPPWQPGYLLCAAGTLCGAVECVLHPPRYQEPPARREYEFELAELNPATD